MNGSSVASAVERPPASERLRRTLQWTAPTAYALALTVFVIVEGVPLTRTRVLVWILLGLLVVSLTNVRGWIRGVLLEWLPFALVLSLYDVLRSQADTLLFSAHVRPQLRADEILFGGTAPTVWLQEHLWHGPLDLRWYDYAASFVYASYFLATYVVAAILWFAARGLFRRFVAMVSLLALMGFTTYALFPAAPPWLASEYGALEPSSRSIELIWSEIPVVGFNSLFERGSQYANPVAAVPSLHAAYTLLVVLILWRLVRGWGRVLLVAYPWAMAFALVYTAEHYFVDVLLGWAYALVAYWTVNRLADRFFARGANPAPVPYVATDERSR